MRSYPTYSNKRVSKRKKRLIYFLLLVVVIFGLKAFKQSSAPAPSFATQDQWNLPLAEIPKQTKPEDVSTPPQPLDLPKAPKTGERGKKELANLLEQVEADLNQEPKRIIEARDKFNEMLAVPMSDKQQRFVKQSLTALSNEWLLSRQVYPNDNLCQLYKVQPGDLFRKIAKKCKVPYEFLMKINNISDPKLLRAGETIKVVNGPFHCRISRSMFTMDLYLQDTYVRSFVVSIGCPGMETPTGRWLVKPGGKLISPTWTDPSNGKTYQAHDPDYPLGSRWIGLNGIEGEAKDRTGFAIHGTKKTEEIGKAISRGCIRLYNDDVILLYDLLMPGFSQVLVSD
jgi:LysM repeat protein